MKKTAFILAAAVSLVLGGCGGPLGEVRHQFGAAAERQCARPPWVRQMSQMAGLFVLDGAAVPALLCKGTPEYDAAKENAQTALGIYGALQKGDAAAAFDLLADAAAESGIAVGDVVGADGCFTRDGWRLCPPPPD